MKKTYRKSPWNIWCVFALSAAVCMSCGPKYEPISLEGSSSRATREETKSETGQKEQTLAETTAKQDRAEQTTTSAADTLEELESDSIEAMGPEETETVETSAIGISETDGNGETNDAFYQQCGMSREEAESDRIGFIEDVMNENKEAVAARIMYPRTVTVAAGTFEVQDAAGFMAYYDEIFTESFKAQLDQEAEQELFCQNGMVSFGSGLIWFFPSGSGGSMDISSINGLDGCSVRYGR